MLRSVPRRVPPGVRTRGGRGPVVLRLLPQSTPSGIADKVLKQCVARRRVLPTLQPIWVSYGPCPPLRRHVSRLPPAQAEGKPPRQDSAIINFRTPTAHGPLSSSSARAHHGPEYTNRFNLSRAAQIIGGPRLVQFWAGHGRAPRRAKDVLPPEMARMGGPSSYQKGWLASGGPGTAFALSVCFCLPDPGGALIELVASVLGAPDGAHRGLRRFFVFWLRRL